MENVDIMGVFDIDAQLAPGGNGENIGMPGLGASLPSEPVMFLSLCIAVGIGERNGEEVMPDEGT